MRTNRLGWYGARVLGGHVERCGLTVVREAGPVGRANAQGFVTEACTLLPHGEGIPCSWALGGALEEAMQLRKAGT